MCSHIYMHIHICTRTGAQTGRHMPRYFHMSETTLEATASLPTKNSLLATFLARNNRQTTFSAR